LVLQLNLVAGRLPDIRENLAERCGCERGEPKGYAKREIQSVAHLAPVGRGVGQAKGTVKTSRESGGHWGGCLACIITVLSMNPKPIIGTAQRKA